MAVSRPIHYSYALRLPLLGLFFIIVLLSIVLTLISLNERLESSRLWHMMAERSQAQIGLVPQEPGRATSADPDPGANAIQDADRISRILRLKKFRSKVSLLRSAMLSKYRNGTVDQGWRVLPGDVVVHDGEFDNPHKFTYITNVIESCKGFFDERRTNALIFIESDAKNSGRRQVIRETWALPMLQKALNFKVVFMLGSARTMEIQDIVNEEFYAYGDIVQENFTESFKHLSLKSVMGLKWTQTYCPEADFVVKTDDDIVIHAPNLMAMVAGLKDKKDSLLCHKNRSRQIIRRGSPLLKYQVSKQELPGNYFPAYCGGFFYLMSRGTAQKLYAAAVRTPYFFIEDVYITGFCRHKAGVELLDHPHIVLRPHVTPAQAACHFSDGRVTSQELEQDEMRHIWKALNTRGFFCPVPVARLGRDTNATKGER